MSKKKIERPEYIIKVDRNWRYGRHARFWEIQRWYGTDEKGYWSSACRGGLAYTEWGMWWAIRRRLKKMQLGYSNTYFNLDKSKIEELL